MLLCSLSNFDAYFITRLHKSPRPFTFAVKSTDNLSFFENKADYLHVFSCGEKEGNIWMEKILVARVSPIPRALQPIDFESDAFEPSRTCYIKKSISSSIQKRVIATLQAVFSLVLARGRHHQLAHHKPLLLPPPLTQARLYLWPATTFLNLVRCCTNKSNPSFFAFSLHHFVSTLVCIAPTAIDLRSMYTKFWIKDTL